MTSRRPVVLWVTPVAELAGVSRHILDFFEAGSSSCDLVLACPPGPLAELTAACGHRVITDAIDPGVGVIKSWLRLRRAIRQLQPQIVHSHLAYADVVAAAACLGLRVRLVSTEHGIAADDLIYHGNRLKSAIKALMHRIRLLRADALIAVSKATADAMRAKWRPKQPIDIVYNGVDAPPTPPVQAPGLRIATLSRLAPEKRIDALIDGFALLKQRLPQATLTIAGIGPMDAELREMASRLGEASGIRFVGYRPADEVLRDADVIAQLSVWENCSYALLDAVSAGTGVCATDVGGNPEILPSQCLVTDLCPETIADILEEQGLALRQRPARATEWPTTVEMARQIREVYARIT